MKASSLRSRFVAVCAGACLASGALATDYVVPRFVLRTSGDGTYSCDLTLHLAYTGASSSTVQLTMLGSTGAAILSLTMQAVCNPCEFVMDPDHRHRAISFSQLVKDAGGFPAPVVTGFATMTVTGDGGNLAGHLTSVNEHAGPGDVANHDQPLITVGPGLGMPPVAVLDHLFEQVGTNGTATYTFDSWVEVAYTGDSSADLDVYLRLPDATPLRSATATNVCYPCTLHASTAARLALLNVDSRIVAAGGFPVPDIAFWAELVASGDAEHLAVDGVILNTESNPFEVAFERYAPQAVESRAPDPLVFASNFEHGDFTGWSSVVGGP